MVISVDRKKEGRKKKKKVKKKKKKRAERDRVSTVMCHLFHPENQAVWLTKEKKRKKKEGKGKKER